MGKFMNPVSGFWANAETSDPADHIFGYSIPGLKDEVEVVFDERRVPHIFARNEHDLFLTQGYITAMHRLFQMEIQTYDAAGRLSEIIGKNPGAQRRDLYTRRWGMPWAAEKKLEAIKQDSASWDILQAYAKGVNAWINQLEPADYPIEYKVLDAAPEEWAPLKTALLHMNMSRTLAGGSSDDRTSNTIAYFGEDYVEQMFGSRARNLEPIIPEGTIWNFDVDLPPAPDSLFLGTTAEKIQHYSSDLGVGSNNWAVDGSKTKSGYPILAGDPHLSLSMPSIWLELQLHAPGYNTYGVAFQGIPGILIGFNEHIAFTETNVGSDVLDWYEIKFRDESKEEYWYDGDWHPTTKRIEEIKVRGEESILDTLVFTHHGPVIQVNSDDSSSAPVYHAMRWIAHVAGNSLKAFIGLNKARNYDEYREALKNYIAPAQNFLVATNEGDIGITVNGQFPKKWKYQGRTVSDGTDPLYDWQGWIPYEHNPTMKNPDRGFVSSANQASAGVDYPYYLGDDYAPYERGRRINDLLRDMSDITPEDMMRMQMDNYSLHAESILPKLRAWTVRDSLDEFELEVFEQMFQWDFGMDAGVIQPSVFYWWWRSFYWDMVRDEQTASGVSLRNPPRDRLIEIIKRDPEYFLIDNVETEKKENIRDLATSSFKKAINTMKELYGKNFEKWDWGIVMDNDIEHVGQIPGMGVNDVYSGGSSEAINATRFGYGPSWRMVVELGPEVKGWGVYPGGITGNPGSPNYDAFIENWRKGEHFELNFYREKPDEFNYLISLIPEEQ